MLWSPGSSWGFVPCSMSHLSHGIEGGENARYSQQNLNGLRIETVLAFGGLKQECIFTIVWWLCPHTAKTHLYAN